MSSTARRFTRCCDAQGAGAEVLRTNAIFTALCLSRVNREVSTSVYRRNAISGSTRRITRCCDAQGADAVVYRKNAIYCRPSWWPR